jgi:hypothetical protein
MIYRQGDVMIIQVMAVPLSAKEEPSNNDSRIVLAYGEVTGHAHSIAKQDVQVRMWSADAERFIQALSEITITHEEHAPIVAPPGIYKVVIQREYSPEAIRNVAD